MADQITVYNRYPEWVSLHLEALPTEAESQEYDLFLTLVCQEQWQDLLNGRVKWGIKGGTLQVTGQNFVLLPAQELPENPFGIMTTEVKEQWQWLFSLKNAQFAFNGSLAALKLGKVRFTDSSYRLNFTFALRTREISLTDAEGLWKHDITPNKHGILERKIAQSLYLSQLQGWVSGLQLSSSNLPLEPIAIAPRADVIAELGNSIEQIYQSPTNDLFTLAQLTGLDPLQDLAGGSFLGMELSGIQWGGANLYHINLRGANLTDADLSEANLSYAKLSGADLSGAYLGNANLSYANLHKASLALTNLIGAKLEEANLEEANLTNANFSGAQVINAKFAANVGMNVEMAESLRARGAKVV